MQTTYGMSDLLDESRGGGLVERLATSDEDPAADEVRSVPRESTEEASSTGNDTADGDGDSSTPSIADVRRDGRQNDLSCH